MKSIVADLEKAEELLGAKELDGGKIKQLVVKLGKETVALGKSDVANASHIEQLERPLRKPLRSGDTGKVSWTLAFHSTAISQRYTV